MSKLFKLIFLALLSAFIVGCGHHSGGSSSKSDNTTLGDDNTSTIDDNNTKDDNGTTDDNNATEDNTTAIEKFVSDFPIFDDGGKAISNSFIVAQYSPVSAAEAKAVNATLTGVKDFTYDDYSDGDIINYLYKPNYNPTTKNLTDDQAHLYIDNDYSELTFSLEAENRIIAYSELDNIFGTVNATINAVNFTIYYDVDMSDEYSAYYQQLLDDGVFEAEDCSVVADALECLKYDGTFYYYWHGDGKVTNFFKATFEP